MNQADKKNLQILACKVRMGIIESTHSAKAGHPGGSLSAADLFTYLYFQELKVDPKNPQWEDRDRFVLSKGSPLVAAMQMIPSSLMSTLAPDSATIFWITEPPLPMRKRFCRRNYFVELGI